MQLNNLSLAPTTVQDPDTDLVWHTQWFVPSTSDANGGKNFHVYAESTSGGALQCFVGENAVQLVGGGGVLTYPGKTQLPAPNCQSTLGPNGNITIYVPLSNVTEADPIDGRLHEVTASTMTLQGPANTDPPDPFVGIGGVFFNLIDVAQGYVFDPTVVTAVSRKTHSNAGTFDLDLPLTGTPGIECRSGGTNGDHQLVVRFGTPVSFASIATSCGGISGITTSGNETTVNLTAVPNASRCSLTLHNVNNGITPIADVIVPVNFLLGDTNADENVNSADISQTKGESGNAVTNSNFREDLNLDGALNSADISLVKSKSGTGLP
jgi:hypothetical protein